MSEPRDRQVKEQFSQIFYEEGPEVFCLASLLWCYWAEHNKVE